MNPICIEPDIRIAQRDFPGGPGVKNPPANAGKVGSIPGWETKIPHAVRQLSPWATTTESCVPQLEKKTMHCNSELHAVTKTQHSQK